MNLKKIALICVIMLVVIGSVIVAGCTSTASSDTENTDFAMSYAGTWYSTGPYYDSGINENSMLKLEINPDGTGTETWYSMSYVPYCSNTFKISKTAGGSYNLSFDPPLSSNYWYVNPMDGILTSTLGVRFSKTKWDGLDTANTVPTKKASEEHNPNDYVEDGDYYLEDANGRSFTETLWSGNVVPYIAEYKSLPKLSTARGKTQGGEWVKYVRTLATDHHSYESTNPVTYQTIDETIAKGYGTCNDLAILAARGLKELGYDVAILVFPNHMDLGIAKKDAVYLDGYLNDGYYAIYSIDNKMYDGYYYINIADYQNFLDVGQAIGETGFTYDMTLKKMIIL